MQGGQGFKSPQLHPRPEARSGLGHPRIPALAQQMRSNRQCAADPLVQGTVTRATIAGVVSR